MGRIDHICDINFVQGNKTRGFRSKNDQVYSYRQFDLVVVLPMCVPGYLVGFRGKMYLIIIGLVSSRQVMFSLVRLYGRFVSAGLWIQHAEHIYLVCI